jgi:hypothetical protein
MNGSRYTRPDLTRACWCRSPPDALATASTPQICPVVGTRRAVISETYTTADRQRVACRRVAPRPRPGAPSLPSCARSAGTLTGRMTRDGAPAKASSVRARLPAAALRWITSRSDESSQFRSAPAANGAGAIVAVPVIVRAAGVGRLSRPGSGAPGRSAPTPGRSARREAYLALATSPAAAMKPGLADDPTYSREDEVAVEILPQPPPGGRTPRAARTR